MNKYPNGTAEYSKLAQQVDGIAAVMASYGFADKTNGTNNTPSEYIIYEQIGGPAIEIPNVAVAGGNVDITTGTVTGSGKITANPAKTLTINNSTNKSLAINDITMDTAGGKIYLNDVLTSGSINGVNTQSAHDITPSLTINNTGSPYKSPATTTTPAYSKAPDIAVNGNVSNSAGSVTLKNKTGSVYINGNIYSLTSTTVDTPNGGTIIDNSSGLQNVGADPMLKWTFNNKKYTDKLQQYVGTNNVSKDFNKYDEYLKWVWEICGRDLLNELINGSGNDWEDKDKWRNAMRAKYDSLSNYNYAYKVVISSGCGGGSNGTFGEYIKNMKGVEIYNYNYISGKLDEATIVSDSPLSSVKYTNSITSVSTKDTTPSGSIVSGGAVSVIAKTLNVNGLIQSGFNNYVAKTSSDLFNQIKRGEVTRTYPVSENVIMADTKKIKTTGLKDETVLGNGDYKINDTEDNIQYNSTSGLFDKVVGLYYNPSTNHILNDSIQVTGGQIYLKATDFISTGGGKIAAVGGGADVNIESNVNADLYLSDINTTNRGTPLVMINNDNVTSSTYSPKSNAVYGWTGGINYNEIVGKQAITTQWAWGLLPPFSSTEAVVNKLKDITSINTLSNSTGDTGKPLDPGVFADNSGNGSLFSIKTTKVSGDKRYGEMITDSYFEEWYDYVIGRKTNKYTWTETTPNAVTTSYKVNAAQPISIVRAEPLTTAVKIKSTGSGNLIIAGDLDLTPVAIGSISLEGKGNIKTEEGRKLSATNYHLTANGTGKTVDVTLGTTNKLRSAELYLNSSNSNTFNITNQNPLLYVTADTTSSNVNIETAGDVRGNLQTKDLSITTPGHIYLNNSKANGTLSLDAKGSAYFEGTGDVKIGHIKSGSTATIMTDGNIINSVDKAVSMSGAEQNIAAWEAAGIINAKDSASSKTNAAAEEKAVRLKGLENLFKQWAIDENGKLDEKYYNQLIKHTADTSDFTTEQLSQYDLYQTLKNSKDYGFSKNELLYAVQEGILNPEAGIIPVIDDPIIVAESIYLQGQNIGKDLETVTYTNLNDTNTLKKLAGAKMGDVTFNSNGSITLKEQSPVTIDITNTNANTLLTPRGNTYIAGTPSTRITLPVNFDIGNNNLVLMTGNGITANDGIVAKNVELYAGNGDLSARNLSVSGKLTANANGNINLTSRKALTVENVTSGGNVNINSSGAINSASKSSKVVAKDTITLTTPNKSNTTSFNQDYYNQLINLRADTSSMSAELKSKYEQYRSKWRQIDEIDIQIQSNEDIGYEERNGALKQQRAALLKELESFKAYFKEATTTILSEIGTSSLPLYVDAIRVNTNVDSAKIYLTGDFRYLNNQPNYYTFTPKNGGDYLLNKKAFISTTNNNYDFTIRSLGDLRLGNVYGKNVTLKAGEDLVGDGQQGTLNISNTLTLSGNSTYGLKTSAPNVVTSLTGTLELTGTNDMTLTSEKELKIKTLNVGSKNLTVNVMGDYSNVNDNVTARITAGKLDLTATGDINLTNTSLKTTDTYSGENINITTNTSTLAKLQATKDVNITQTWGTMTINQIEAGGEVTLTNTSSKILSGVGSGNLIKAETVNFNTPEKNGDIGTSAVPINIDAMTVNVYKGNSNLYLDGDYRWLNRIDSSGNTTTTPHYYTFTPKAGGDYLLDKKSFISTNSNTNDFTIRSNGELAVGNVSGKNVTLKSGSDILGLDGASVNASGTLALNAQNVKNLTTSAKNVTTDLSGTLDLTATNDMTLSPKGELVVEKLSAADHKLTINITGDYSNEKNEGLITAKSININATGDMNLTNPTVGSEDTYSANNINISASDALPYYNNENIKASNIKRVEDTETLGLVINKAQTSALDLSTDKKIYLATPKQLTDRLDQNYYYQLLGHTADTSTMSDELKKNYEKYYKNAAEIENLEAQLKPEDFSTWNIPAQNPFLVKLRNEQIELRNYFQSVAKLKETPTIKVKADRDINITATTDLKSEVENSEHNTNIEAGDNSLTLSTINGNNLSGTMNASALTINSSGDLDLTTTSTINSLKANNIKLNTQSEAAEVLDNLTYSESLAIESPETNYIGAKVKGKSFDVSNGKTTTVDADVPIKIVSTGKANLVSDKNITGTTNIKGALSVSATGNIDLTETDNRLYIGQILSKGDVHIETEKYGIMSGVKYDNMIRGVNVNVHANTSLGSYTVPLYIRYVDDCSATTGKGNWLRKIDVAQVSRESLFEERAYKESNEKDLKQLARSLNESNILTNKSGDDYNNTIKAWLSGMGYTAQEEQRVIELTRELSFSDLSASKMLNAAVEEIASQYSAANLNSTNYV